MLYILNIYGGGINAGKGKEFGRGVGDIGSGKAKGTADTITVDDHARDGIRIAKKTVGILYLSLFDEATDTRGTDGQAFVQTLCGVVYAQSDAGGKALIVCEIRQTVGAETMVIAHEKRLYTVLIVKAVHKILRSEVLHLTEIQKSNLCELLQHGDTFLQGGEHSRCLSAEHLQGVLTERIDDRLQTLGVSQGLQLLKEKAVSAMDTVKDADGAYKTKSRTPLPPFKGGYRTP